MKRTSALKIVTLPMPPTRVAFENWVHSEHPADDLSFDAGGGRYLNPGVQYAWKAWQAARKTPRAHRRGAAKN